MYTWRALLRENSYIADFCKRGIFIVPKDNEKLFYVICGQIKFQFISMCATSLGILSCEVCSWISSLDSCGVSFVICGSIIFAILFKCFYQFS